MLPALPALPRDGSRIPAGAGLSSAPKSSSSVSNGVSSGPGETRAWALAVVVVEFKTATPAPVRLRDDVCGTRGPVAGLSVVLPKFPMELDAELVPFPSEATCRTPTVGFRLNTLLKFVSLLISSSLKNFSSSCDFLKSSSMDLTICASFLMRITSSGRDSLQNSEYGIPLVQRNVHCGFSPGLIFLVQFRILPLCVLKFESVCLLGRNLRLVDPASILIAFLVV
jgi:hypothetical protein